MSIRRKNKNKNALKKIEHKLLKHEKQKYQNALSNTAIKTKLFPRKYFKSVTRTSFFLFEVRCRIFDLLKKELKPFEHKFTLISDQ